MGGRGVLWHVVTLGLTSADCHMQHVVVHRLLYSCLKHRLLLSQLTRLLQQALQLLLEEQHFNDVNYDVCGVVCVGGGGRGGNPFATTPFSISKIG